MTAHLGSSRGMGALLATAVGLCAAPALAAEPATDDGVYGRFDGDLDIGVGLWYLSSRAIALL